MTCIRGTGDSSFLHYFNKIDNHHIIDILLIVALNTITPILLNTLTYFVAIHRGALRSLKRLNTCYSQLCNVRQQLATCSQQLAACNSQTTPSPPQPDTVCLGQLDMCNAKLTNFTSQRPDMIHCTPINGIRRCKADPGCDISCVASTVLALYNWYTDTNTWCIIDFSLIYWKSVNVFSCPEYLEHLAQPMNTPVIALDFCYPYFHLTLTNVCHTLMYRLVYCNVLQILLSHLQVSMVYIGLILGVPSVRLATVEF